jgi:hypothetical protein
MKAGHISDDGLWSFTEVECMGNCSSAPMVQINDDNYEDLTEERLDRSSMRWRAAKRPRPARRSRAATRSSPPMRCRTCMRWLATTTIIEGVVSHGPAGQGSHFHQPLRLSAVEPDAARKRGDWDNTKALLEKGRDGIIQEMKDSGCAGAAARASPPA